MTNSVFVVLMTELFARFNTQLSDVTKERSEIK